jgi:hypothetical protein
MSEAGGEGRSVSCGEEINQHNCQRCCIDQVESIGGLGSWRCSWSTRSRRWGVTMPRSMKLSAKHERRIPAVDGFRSLHIVFRNFGKY